MKYLCVSLEFVTLLLKGLKGGGTGIGSFDRNMVELGGVSLRSKFVNGSHQFGLDICKLSLYVVNTFTATIIFLKFKVMPP